MCVQYGSQACSCSFSPTFVRSDPVVQLALASRSFSFAAWRRFIRDLASVKKQHIMNVVPTKPLTTLVDPRSILGTDTKDKISRYYTVFDIRCDSLENSYNFSRS